MKGKNVEKVMRIIGIIVLIAGIIDLVFLSFEIGEFFTSAVIMGNKIAGAGLYVIKYLVGIAKAVLFMMIGGLAFKRQKVHVLTAIATILFIVGEILNFQMKPLYIVELVLLLIMWVQYFVKRKNSAVENTEEIQKPTKVIRNVAIAAAVVFIASAIGGYCEITNYMDSVKKSEEQVTTAFTSMEAEDFDGNTVTSDIFNGKKLTMINVWATTCNPCLSEMPNLAALNKEYEAEGFQVIGICADATDQMGIPNASQMDLARICIDETGADYLHLISTESLNNSFINSVVAVPTTVFVNEKGEQIGNMILGAYSKEAWAQMIEEKLKTLE